MSLSNTETPVLKLKGRASLLQKRQQVEIEAVEDANTLETVNSKKRSRFTIQDSDDEQNDESPFNQGGDSLLDVQDRLDEMLEMNEAMAHIVKRKDPLFEEEPEALMTTDTKENEDQDKLHLFNENEEDILYDSDGNPLNDDYYGDEDEESTHELTTDQIIERRNARLVNGILYLDVKSWIRMRH